MTRSNDSADALAAIADATSRPGETSRTAAINAQLFRYAEDLQLMIERQSVLEADYRKLRAACVPLTESRNKLDALIGRSLDLHVVTDTAGRVLQSNPASAVLAPPERFDGSLLRQWVVPACHENYESLLQRALQGAPGVDEALELRLQCAAHDRRQLIVSAQALAVQHDGMTPGVHWILRDLSGLREIEFASQISALVFKNAAEGVLITDIDGVIVSVNPSFSRITGYSAEEAVGRQPGDLLKSGVHDEAFYAAFWTSLLETGAWQGEIHNRKKSGEVYPEWLTVSAARDDDGRIASFIAVFVDLSHVFDQTQQRLAYVAHHDMLTTLPNRLLFHERVCETLAQARRASDRFSLILIALDRFKQINDELGLHVGDGVLQEAARRLSATVRRVDTVARLGGNEFVIIAPGLAGDDDIGRFCAKLLAALRRSMSVEGRELFIGGSVGCSTYPLHGDDEVGLLKHAVAAMYRAKAAGGNTYFIHDAAWSVGHGTLHMEAELRRAIGRGQLHLEFQPQIATADGATVGVEALLRWDHPEFGSVSPAQFIPIVEEAGLIVSIGDWVLNAACRQLADWDRQNVSIASMGVNLSPRQLRDPGIVDQVRAAVAASGIAPGRLELEVTESEILFQLDADRRKLDALRETGVKIAIDDFGSGYSSLGRLLQLPIDRLKLDRSFACELEPDGDSRAGAITAAILALGKALGVELVVEGVETEAQYELLAGQGFQVIQGYLTGRPMAPDVVAQRFRQFAAGEGVDVRFDKRDAPGKSFAGS